jgi:hypothetical protein
MTVYTERFTEYSSLLLHDEEAYAAGVYTSGYVSMANYHRAALVFAVLTMGAGATIDVAIRQATDTAGASAKAITDKNLTQLTQAGGDASTISAIELRTEELDVTGGFDCICVRVTVTVDICLCAWQLYGIVPRFKPVGTTGWNEVVD